MEIEGDNESAIDEAQPNFRQNYGQNQHSYFETRDPVHYRNDYSNAQFGV